MWVPQLVISADVHLALPGALWHVLKLNCVNESGRYYHAKRRRFVHNSQLAELQQHEAVEQGCDNAGSPALLLGSPPRSYSLLL